MSLGPFQPSCPLEVRGTPAAPRGFQGRRQSRERSSAGQRALDHLSPCTGKPRALAEQRTALHCMPPLQRQRPPCQLPGVPAPAGADQHGTEAAEAAAGRQAPASQAGVTRTESRATGQGQQMDRRGRQSGTGQTESGGKGAVCSPRQLGGSAWKRLMSSTHPVDELLSSFRCSDQLTKCLKCRVRQTWAEGEQAGC